jgi:hypothetical protein
MEGAVAATLKAAIFVGILLPVCIVILLTVPVVASIPMLLIAA